MVGLFDKLVFRLSGDHGLLVEYGDAIDLEVNRRVRRMCLGLEKESPPWVVEVLPTYRSLLILYDPSRTAPAEIEAYLLGLEDRLAEIEIPPPQTTQIPVCYRGEFGPDIKFVAETHDLGVEEVIRLHAEPLYQIYMIGFTPGFPFLGGLPKVLETPRLETPRAVVPAGSVGIANDQTGVYPIASPGGWRLIGRTPLKLFDPGRPSPFLLKAGDMLRFRPVSREEYDFLLEGSGP